MSNVITPEVNAEGQYIGSNIEQRGEGLWRHHDQSQDFIHNEVTGSTRHIMEDVELADPDGPGDQDAEYLSNLVELHGGSQSFQTKLAWAAQNQDPSRIEWFNDALDRGDTASLNQAFDWLSAEYEAAMDAPTEEETTEEDATDVEEWFDSISDEAIDAELDTLLGTELGETEVEALEKASQHFDAGTPESAIIMYGIAVANGQLSMEEAIEQVTTSYGEAASFKAYAQLQQLLN